MKKLFLLLATGLLATASNGQEAATNMMFNHNNQPMVTHTARPIMGQNSPHLDYSKLGMGRATATGGATEGWFDYVDTIFNNNPDFVTPPALLNPLPLWPDTAAIFGYNDGGSPAYYGYSVTSYGYWYSTTTGMSLDPFATPWASYHSLPLVTPTNNYIVDSVQIIALYGRPLTGASYNDQITLSFVYGDGTSTSNMPIGYFGGAAAATLLGDYGIVSPDTALYFPNMLWDSAANGGQATNTSGGAAPVTFTETLTQADTNVANWGVYTYALPGSGMSVPMGNLVGMSISFASGATTFPAFPTVDTVAYGNTTGEQLFKYGSFEPAVAFDYNTSTSSVSFPPYGGGGPGTSATGDYTTGYFKPEGSIDGNGWTPSYIPNWAWSTSTGGASIQYPYVLFHIQCPTCASTSTPAVKNVENQVKSYPNPATSEVTIAYNLAVASDVTVNLTNMMGQIVATQHVAGTSTGSVQFSTSALPDGIYFYTLNANGTLNTGRIVVAH